MLCNSYEVEEKDDKLLVVLLEDVINDLGRKFVFEVLVELIGSALKGRTSVPNGTDSPVGSSDYLLNPLHVLVHSVLHYPFLLSLRSLLIIFISQSK